MAGTFGRDVFDALDEGNVIEYVERRVFDGKIDSLSSHIERKRAVAEPTRYSILYLLYEYGRVSRKRLATETNRDGNGLQHHLRDLLDTNLIAEIPAPEDADGRQTYYRITTLGKQEIASDIDHIVGGNSSDDRFEVLGDPELVDSKFDTTDRTRPLVIAGGDEIGVLQDRRSDLRSRRNDFQDVAGRE